ncbi:putative myb dna-binding domain-containing protein [Lasiodiplodia theobromae]|uniref:Myb dna-binding domain-containing protein n=1 Tax=Lasiodiplodia theobromae TaxID=45133 RepID=A0A8H7IRA6_9PEZI|nr:putative myb dna-binding domain-containing protein [Lasiodiplodia theobromae]
MSSSTVNQSVLDDARIIALKEGTSLTWAEIARHFPNKTRGSIQVRYCRSLKADTAARRAALAANAAGATTTTISGQTARNKKTAAAATATAEESGPSAPAASAPSATTAPATGPVQRARRPAARAPASQPRATRSSRRTQPTRSANAQSGPSAPPAGPSAREQRAARRNAIKPGQVAREAGGIRVPAGNLQTTRFLSTAHFSAYDGYAVGGEKWGDARWEGFTGKYLK